MDECPERRRKRTGAVTAEPQMAMYREPSLHDVAEQGPPRKTPKTSGDSPVLKNGKKDPKSKSKSKTSSS
ncbi:hypothetical protein EYF80_049181 [Liparis tanakae]|uniref:Uncharacterized protein n=1 Tax=Liparis tanakae TaxID=230148 RepID=A0A4Z2FK28_9TELE|nr:hypothetical protein EYF80_049181 [Liparis tanakae]